MKILIPAVAFLVALPLASLSGQQKEDGYIDVLVAALNEDGGWWKNGLSQQVELPEDATAEEVLKAAIKLEPKDSPHRANYKIMENGKVTINNHPYLVMLLEYPTGLVIFLCDNMFKGSWWNRFIPIPNKKEPNKAEMATPRKPSD